MKLRIVLLAVLLAPGAALLVDCATTQHAAEQCVASVDIDAIRAAFAPDGYEALVKPFAECAVRKVAEQLAGGGAPSATASLTVGVPASARHARAWLREHPKP